MLRLVGMAWICSVLVVSALGEEAVAGWYDVGDGLRLVMPSAKGGYRLVSPDGEQFDWLAPAEDGSFEWRDRDKRREARVQFTFEDGAVAGFTWERDGDRGRARRLDEQPYGVAAIEFKSGAISLSGNLYQPLGVGPIPAVVFVHGSGTNDRDNSWMFRFADLFARRGVASLIPDKRGGGKSGGDWRTVGFEEYARDALAAVTFLRARPDIGVVGVFGSSQGGQVAPIAGVLDPNVAFVVDVSGSLVTLGQQVRHEVQQDLRSDGATEEIIALTDELFELSHAYIRTGAGWDTYLERLQEIRKGPSQRAAFGFVSSPDNWYWTWWRQVIDVDPIEHWQALEVPGLIVYGRDDERDNVPVSLSVERFERELGSRENLTLRVFENTGHGLMDAERGGIREDFLAFLWAWMSPLIEAQK